jgi:hypothetical protein
MEGMIFVHSAEDVVKEEGIKLFFSVVFVIFRRKEIKLGFGIKLILKKQYSSRRLDEKLE